MSYTIATNNEMRTLTPVFLGVMVAGIGLSVGISVVSLILERHGVSPFVNGLTTTVSYVGSAVAAAPTGRLVARWGGRPVLLAGMLACMATMAAFPLLNGLAAWFVLRLLNGAACAVVFVATEILINQVSSANTRGRNLGIYSVAISVGLTIGAPGVALIDWGEWVPFAVGAAVALAAAVPAWWAPQGGALAEQRPDSSWRLIWRLAPLGLSTALMYGFLDTSLEALLPVYGARRGLSNAEVGLLITSFVVGGIVLQLPLNMLSDRMDRRLVIRLTALLCLGCLAWAAVSPVNLALYVVFAVAGGVIGALYTLGLALVAEQTHPRDVALANGTYSAFFGMGSVVGPALPALAMQWWGPSALFGACAVPIGLYLAYEALLARR